MKYRFKEIQKETWPAHSENVLHVLKSAYFLVQVINDNDRIRITVNRTEYVIKDGEPIWKDKITWDELQAIKNAVGFEKFWCVECYPPEDKVINVAPLRHLWVLDETPVFGWHK